MCADTKLFIVFPETYIRYTYTVPIILKVNIEKQEEKLDLLEHYLQLSRIIN